MTGCEWILQLGWEESSLGIPTPLCSWTPAARYLLALLAPGGRTDTSSVPRPQKVSARALHRWSQDRAGQGVESSWPAVCVCGLVFRGWGANQAAKAVVPPC